MMIRDSNNNHDRVVLALLCAACAGIVVACATLTRPKVRRANLGSLLKFSHKKHVGEADCSDCHGEVANSTGATLGRFINKEHGGCGDCHEDEIEDKGKCGMCHRGSDREVELTRLDRRLKFSHAAHLKRVKGKKAEACKVCHPKAWTAVKPGVKLTGDMNSCVSACHREEMGNQQCTMCHRDLRRQGLEPVVQLGHRGNFVNRHGALAKDMRRCASCHDQAHCAGCHGRTAAMPLSLRFPERIDASFIHRGDYLSRHAVEARARPDTCRKCHGASSCAACHQQRGIAGTTVAAKGTAHSPHGPDVMTPGAPGFHGRLARRAINRCASCHDRGASSNCVECHAVGQLGGNPHPKGFRWQDKRTACRTETMCRVCHAGGAGCP